MTTRWEFERAVFASGLPAPSRLILLTLAAHTDAGTCVVPAKFTPSLSTLAERTGLTRKTVIVHLDALDTAGWVERDKPDPAAQRSKRACTQYKLTIPTGVGATPVLPSSGVPPTPAVVNHVHQRRGLGGVGATPNQNKIPRTSQTSRATDPFAAAGLDVTDDERTAVINRITQAANIRNLPAYLATLAANGDLAEHVAAIRQDRQASVIAAELAAARTGPDCIHGNPGGQHRRSDTGRLLCPQCHRNHERNTA
jgi:hypothetical protein